jgi:hypothetical protein
MTELVQAVRLKFDGSSVVGQAPAAAKAIDSIAEAARKVGPASASIATVGVQAASVTAALGTASSSVGDLSAALRSVGGAAEGLREVRNALADAGSGKELTTAISAIEAQLRVAGRTGEEAGASLSQGLAQAGRAADELGSNVVSLESRLNRATTAGRAHTVSAGQQRAAMQDLGFQINDFSTQVLGGTSVIRAFTQQSGQVAFALSGMQGAAGAVGSFLAGPWGALILVGVSVLGEFVSKLFETEPASDAASKGIDNFAKSQQRLASVIDATTGRLREQQRVQAQAAAGTLPGAIRASNSDQITATTDAFAKARAFLASEGHSRAGTNDPYLKRAIDDANGSVTALARNLDALAVSAPKLKPLRDQVAGFADKAVTAHQNTVGLVGTLRDYNTALAGGVVQTTALIDRQVESATATTATAKAQAHLNDVKARSKAIDDMASGAAKDKALASYRADLTAATTAVNAAQAAEKGATAGRREANAETRAAAKAAREAAAANRELENTLASLIKRFDPATASAAEFRKRLGEIDTLQSAGKIDLAESLKLGRGAQQQYQKEMTDQASAALSPFLNDTKDLQDALEEAVKPAALDLEEAGTHAGEALRSSGLNAVDAISQALGGKLGKAAGALAALVAPSSAGEESRSGGLGSIGALLNSAPVDPYGGRTAEQVRDAGGLAPGVMDAAVKHNLALGNQYQSLTDGIGKLAKGIGISDDAASLIGKKAGIGIEGAAKGALVSSIFNPIAGALGVKTSKLGSQIGGAVGSFLPIPGGDIIGSLAGSIIGGLFKTTPKASVTLGNVDGSAGITGTSGNSKSLIAATTKTGGAVSTAIDSIVQQLGGTLGDFAVSIGYKKGKYRVDTSGKGRTTSGKSNDGVTGYADESEAEAAALADAIKDGAIAGISAAMQRAVQANNGDADKAVSEALKVRSIQDVLSGLGTDLLSSFRTFETSAADRLRVAKAYGLDVVKVEAENAKERAALVASTLKQETGSLQDFLTSLTSGDLSEGDAFAKRTALLSQIDTAKAGVASGTDGAADTLSSLLQNLVSTDRTAFGTAGTEYTADRDLAKSAAEEAIKAANDRIAAAQAAVATTNSSLATANQLTDETNALLAKQTATIANLPAAIAAVLGTSGGLSGVTYTRTSKL